MICPYCSVEDQFVTLDTRSKTWGVRRRKRCLQCNQTFATVEVYQISEEAEKTLAQSKKILRTKRREQKK